MKDPRSIGSLGALLLVIGSFSPAFSAPLVGTVSYFGRGDGWGGWMLPIALFAAVVAVARSRIGLAVMGLASFATIAYSFVVTLDRTKSAGDGAELVSLGWGWGILLAGAVTLLMGAAGESESKGETA